MTNFKLMCLKVFQFYVMFLINFLKFLTFVVHDNMIVLTEGKTVGKIEKEVFKNEEKPERLFNRR